MTFRTYRVGGNFISCDLRETDPPVAFDEVWTITEAEYQALNAHALPQVTEDDQLVIVEPPAPEPEPVPEE